MLWIAVLLACTPSLPDDTDVAGTEAVEPDTELDTEAPLPWPETLSATGLYADIASETLAEDVLTYEPAWPLWSDGAAKERFFALPPGGVIDTSDPDYWQFPLGTRAWKTFIRDGVRVETRYLERTETGWTWIAYAWREDGSDADPVPNGVIDAAGTAHDIPFEGACFRCHQALGLLGVGAVQLGADSPGDTLADWTERGLISDPIAPEDTVVPGEGTTRHALGYLHGNCGGCHIDGYYLDTAFSLRLRTLVGTATPDDSLAYLTAINTPARHALEADLIVAPGDPERSQMLLRMGERGNLQMPPLGTELVDHDALSTVRAWIESLPPSDSETP